MIMNLNAYLNTINGERDTAFVNISQEKIGNVAAVFIDGISIYNLNDEFGAGIDIHISDVEKWMANYRHGEFWCKPSFGESLSDIPDETQGLIYKKKDGIYGVILPVVSQKYKCVLVGGDGFITAKMFSWYDKLHSAKGLSFMYAEGDDPFSLLSECAMMAAKLLNNGLRTRENRRYPEIFEYIGWCSWDAFGISVTEQKLIDKCKEFKEKDIPVRWAIIDDMWGEVRDFYNKQYEDRGKMFNLMYCSKLYSFDADPKRFPNGLKHCIEKMNSYGVKVGVWYPTTGYWRGIDPDGEIYKNCKDYLIQVDNGMYVPDYNQQKAYMYYDAFNSSLRENGAEFVKIDNQSLSRRFYKGAEAIGDIARQFHNAMEASVGQNFDNCMINCMGMASEDMWNRSVSPIIRCSDDFKPENREWFTKHIMQCAYNSIVHGQFYYCDWDMWWTDDAQGLKNSILRAISGGPIYVSDTLNRSLSDVLKPLIFNDGRILRCDRPAMPTIDCLTEDPTASGNIFKIQNVCGHGGVIAAFNIDKDNNGVSGFISPADIEGITGDIFAVYEHFSRDFTIMQKDERKNIKLANSDEFKLYVVVPLCDGFAAIGRTDKFISPKSVRCVHGKEIELVENGEYAYAENNKLVIDNNAKE